MPPLAEAGDGAGGGAAGRGRRGPNLCLDGESLAAAVAFMEAHPGNMHSRALLMTYCERQVGLRVGVNVRAWGDGKALGRRRQGRPARTQRLGCMRAPLRRWLLPQPAAVSPPPASPRPSAAPRRSAGRCSARRATA